jgi:murein DD-endopeptidase MepM/ murein hydrolase activator NlpD
VQLQFHPASRRGSVRTVSLAEAGELVVIGGVAALAVLVVSLWITVPVVVARLAREEQAARVRIESVRVTADVDRVRREAATIRRRARAQADLLNRIAFLYGVAPAAWPRVLAPEHRILADDSPERVADRLPDFLRALENGRTVIARREAEDPSVARDVPAILPLADMFFEPSAYFGPRRSSWTNEDEFLSGIEIAARPGAVVVAPGDGVVAFAGTVRRNLRALWQLGNVVVVSHGRAGATVFGHLGRIDVRRGQKVSRGSTLGTVGSSGWAVSPQLYYEYRRSDGAALRPTDPLFAVLDLSLERRPYSLEGMEATWAPGPLDPLPGIEVGAEQAAASGAPGPRRARRRRL